MTHVLVKWLTDEKWDVYPVRALVDPAVGVRVMTDESALKELKDTMQDVSWRDGEKPARARIGPQGQSIQAGSPPSPPRLG